MTKNTLHHLRIITPGVIFLALSFTVAYPYYSVDALNKFLTATLVPIGIVLTYPIGMLWRTFNIRRLFLGDFWAGTNKNIFDSLIDIVRRGRDLTIDEERYLLEEKRYMDVFYVVIDNSENLRAKAQGVYSNGNIITTLVDIGIMSLIFAIVHLAFSSIFSFKTYHLIAAVILFIVFVLSGIVIRKRAEANHRRLSNDQLRVIENFHSDEVVRLCTEILRNMR